MSDTVKVDFSEPIALFPLPNVVLLPHATLPLHIFEQRYRKMTVDAIDDSQLIAMANFAGDGWRADYEGSPPLRDHVCVGYILQHQLLEDGRFNLLLQGLCRATIIEYVQDTPYRTALLQPTEVDDVMEIDLTEQRERLVDLLHDPTLRQLAGIKAIHEWVRDEIPTQVIVDLAAMSVCDGIDDRYGMLAEPDVTVRLQWLERHLLATRRTLRQAESQGTGMNEDGWHLN